MPAVEAATFGFGRSLTRKKRSAPTPVKPKGAFTCRQRMRKIAFIDQIFRQEDARKTRHLHFLQFLL